jgi:predicted small metal-binding protein
MTCRQLGGGCDLEFKAETFEEMVELSKQHGMEMFQKQDADHLAAMQKIQELMQNPQAMAEFFDEKKQQFAAQPDISN